MLRRRFSRSVTQPVSALVSSRRGVFNCIPEPIGKVHPDVLYGYMQTSYRGHGWAALFKVLPTEDLVGTMGGGGPQSYHHQHGTIQDPEDPRHPIVRYQIGCNKGLDASVHDLVKGDWGPIPPGSRLLQVMYANYLEPYSCNRICAQLDFYGKVPNHNQESLKTNCDYVGETAALIGNVMLGVGTCVMEGATLRADQNAIYLHEGVQVHENVVMITDTPVALHHYTRHEGPNPYQTQELTEGTIRIQMNASIEPNCVLESCTIGPFCRIGHNTKIMKGVCIGMLAWVMPGSVVLQNTHIHDGELWGGAPARKLGKVSKFEWKKPWYHAMLHREMVAEGHLDRSRYGDQIAYQQEALDQLTTLMIQYEEEMPAGVRAQIKEFIEGREPYEHTIARITQASAVCQFEHEDMGAPTIVANAHKEHNSDSKSEYTGSIINVRALAGEKRW